jgi:hypothetical protein
LNQVDESFFPRGEDKPEPIGDAIDPCKRRLLQIEKSKIQDYNHHKDKEGLIELFDSLPDNITELVIKNKSKDGAIKIDIPNDIDRFTNLENLSFIWSESN